jgi:ubiquinone/menaquinone biosynthesis C-methylase UbiE
MKSTIALIKLVLWITCLNLIIFAYSIPARADTELPNYYQEKSWHNPDGIGKFYQNREIAKVMGHQAMLWLEREERETEEKPSLILENLDIAPNDVIADIGAGTGYLSFKLAKLVPEGKVFAVDIQPEMLDVVDFISKDEKITNIEPILGSNRSPNLAENSIDLAIMVDAYHEFEYPREMMQEIVKALKPEGRVILVEYRKENPLVLIKGLHKMSQTQVKKELSLVGLSWQETKNILPQQHLMIFQTSS